MSECEKSEGDRGKIVCVCECLNEGTEALHVTGGWKQRYGESRCGEFRHMYDLDEPELDSKKKKKMMKRAGGGFLDSSYNHLYSLSSNIHLLCTRNQEEEDQCTGLTPCLCQLVRHVHHRTAAFGDG